MAWLAFALFAGLAPVAAVNAASDGVTREAGIDRFATAADISKKNFSVNVPVVYIANGRTGLVDALAAGPAAAKHGGPTLLVTTSSIPPATRAELLRLKPARIVIAGGTGVVSNTVLSQLDPYTTGPVTREAGIDRFATAADISKKNFSVNVPVVYIANGRTGLVDALAAGPAAAKHGGPTLLVTTSSIPPATRAELLRLKPARIVIAGGTGVVSNTVLSQLEAYLGSSPPPPPPANRAPVANDDSASVAEDSSATVIDVLANDSDPDGDALAVAAVAQPANGTVAIASAGASVTYTPNPDYAGLDPFTYTVTDPDGATDTATVQVTVTDTPDNTPPLAEDDFLAGGVVAGCDRVIRAETLLDNDGDPDGDPISIESVSEPIHGSSAILATGLGSVIRYQHGDASAAGGSDSFSYTITDGIDTATATVTIAVMEGQDTDGDGVNDACDPFAAGGANVSIGFAEEFDQVAADWSATAFTGLMTNSVDPSLAQQTTAGTNGSGFFVVQDVSEGDAFRTGNDQDNAFQVGVSTAGGALAGGFGVHGRLCAPYPPAQFASAGIFIGTGDQENYIKAVLNRDNAGLTAVHDQVEVNGAGFGVATKSDAAIAGADCVELRLIVSASGTYSPAYSLDNGESWLGFGGLSPLRTVPSSWFDGTQPLAVGIISTSQGPAEPYVASWDFLRVTGPAP